MTLDYIVAFDLDGTLFSSEPIIGACYEEVVADLNRRHAASYAPPSAAEILRFVGQPARRIAEDLYPDMSKAMRRELADGALHALTRRIRAGEGILFELVRETLTTLRDHGHGLLLVSNCRREYLEAILETYALAGFFESALCNEDDPEAGKSGILRRLANGRAGAMVGDRASDGEAARHARLKWIGCRYGHAAPQSGSENELMSADAVVRSLAEVPPLVERWSSGGT